MQLEGRGFESCQTWRSRPAMAAAAREALRAATRRHTSFTCAHMPQLPCQHAAHAAQHDLLHASNDAPHCRCIEQRGIALRSTPAPAPLNQRKRAARRRAWQEKGSLSRAPTREHTE